MAAIAAAAEGSSPMGAATVAIIGDECPVCQQLWCDTNGLATLACGHGVCLGCVRGCLFSDQCAGAWFKCPYCRADTGLQGRDVSVTAGGPDVDGHYEVSRISDHRLDACGRMQWLVHYADPAYEGQPDWMYEEQLNFGGENILFTVYEGARRDKESAQAAPAAARRGGKKKGAVGGAVPPRARKRMKTAGDGNAHSDRAVVKYDGSITLVGTATPAPGQEKESLVAWRSPHGTPAHTRRQRAPSESLHTMSLCFPVDTELHFPEDWIHSDWVDRTGDGHIGRVISYHRESCGEERWTARFNDAEDDTDVCEFDADDMAELWGGGYIPGVHLD